MNSKDPNEVRPLVGSSELFVFYSCKFFYYYKYLILWTSWCINLKEKQAVDELNLQPRAFV